MILMNSINADNNQRSKQKSWGLIQQQEIYCHYLMITISETFL